ncbi:HAD family hydrolase [Falsihalocynthiibacter sp. S25ZX9]|uniref:HAD family hydrolase n=1 Tax=Falsihalocynthiibacter sp. S25ZX9 TaxID=3240870 RepID=UPI003510D0E1
MKLTKYFAITVLFAATPVFADPLSLWNDTETKTSILEFVEGVTQEGGDNFVPVSDRIAVFDNDGTLWSEKPFYFQGLYAIDRLQEMAKADPSILTSDVLKAADKNDMKGMMAEGEKGLLEIVNISSTNITVEAFKASSHEWLTTAKHPTTGLIFAEMTYSPMIQLLEYLREEDFTTYIVSGGGIDFMRAITQEAYGIPPAQVVGSLGKTHYEVKDGVPSMIKDGGITFVDDKDGKPVGIDRFIGQRPIFAAGNSDGDLAMLEWVTSGEGPTFGFLVHHTDAKREFAYDRDSDVGKLSKGLDEAAAKGWVLVNMAKDWAEIWVGKL